MGYTAGYDIGPIPFVDKVLPPMEFLYRLLIEPNVFETSRFDSIGVLD